MSKNIFVLVLSAFFVVNVQCARILMWIPMASISHQVPLRPLSQELARRGHDVVVITTDPAFPKGKTPANLTEIDVHDVSYKLMKETYENVPKGNKDDWVNQFGFTYDLLHRIVFAEYESPELQNIINGNEHFDLLILESLLRTTLPLSHVYKVPVILVSSQGALFDNAETLGIPTHPILYPSILRQRLYNLTFWEKITEIYNHYKVMQIINNHEEIENRLLKKYFGEDLPPIHKLKNNIDMLFANIHPIFEGNYPVPPNVIYMWGIHKKPEKPLPQDLKTFLDVSKHGVIYMSFGTNTDPTKLPPNIIQKLINVFCQLPYDVLLKWNGDDLPGKCDKIKIGKWFPQSDLLRHPKLRAFVTQGGLQSTDEAITAGVPLVGMPMMGDQWYNVEKYVHLNIGVHVDPETFTEEEFKEAVLTVIKDQSYRKNIKKLGELLRDEPMGGLERAVWWTEYVLRHGGAKHLRSPAANISWAQYLELELVLALLAALLIALSIGLAILYSLYRYISRRYFAGGRLKSD